MRLIDADSIHYTRVLSQQGLNMELAAKVVIDDMPTIDAAPMVHGQRTYQTIWHTPGWGEIYTVYGCCGFRERGKTHHNYCPNCGAKMDQEAGDA